MPESFRTGRMLDETALAANVNSKVIDTKGQPGFGLTYKWTSTLTGTLALWANNDTNYNDTTGAGWVPLGNLATSPAGTAGSAQQEIASSHRYYQVRYTHGSNSGDLVMAVNTDNSASEV
jgi:hypothetical protein